MSAVEHARDERPSARVTDAYRAIAAAGRSDVFITLRPEDQVHAEALSIEERLGRGEALPLAGTLVAVKDNIDAAGMATTAGCPAFAYHPAGDATALARLRGAGALLVGKTTLDQFATGLVGSRSPHGAARSALDATRISGGSSSGSALAVALGFVDLALGTDTAGSGRVPAALNAVLGVKPTRGLVPTTGVVPACRSLDCVSLFARELPLARRALALLRGADGKDPGARAFSERAPLACPVAPVVAVADTAALASQGAPWQRAYEHALARLETVGARVLTVDVEPFLEIGALLYGGALVAERYSAVGAFVEAHRDEVDPIVGAIITAAGTLPAHRLVSDQRRIDEARLVASELFDRADALVLPTVPEHPSIEEVAADPFGVNARMGQFTTFCNLLDLAALTLPDPLAGTEPASAFGVSLFGPAFSEFVLFDLAARLRGEEPTTAEGEPGEVIAVLGAHLSGQPLNHQLRERGARLIETTRTAPDYRLFALATSPPKPGLVAGTPPAAASAPIDAPGIEVELWRLPSASFASFVGEVSPPLAIGPLRLGDGRVVAGFLLAASEAPAGAREITSLGGWRAYLAGGA